MTFYLNTFGVILAIGLITATILTYYIVKNEEPCCKS